MYYELSWREVTVFFLQTYPKDTNEDKWSHLKEVPLVVIVGIEKDKVSRKVRIHESKGEGSCHGSKECSPHHLVGEVV